MVRLAGACVVLPVCFEANEGELASQNQLPTARKEITSNTLKDMQNLADQLNDPVMDAVQDRESSKPLNTEENGMRERRGLNAQNREKKIGRNDACLTETRRPVVRTGAVPGNQWIQFCDRRSRNAFYAPLLACRKTCNRDERVQRRTVNHGIIGVCVIGSLVVIMRMDGRRAVTRMIGFE